MVTSNLGSHTAGMLPILWFGQIRCIPVVGCADPLDLAAAWRLALPRPTRRPHGHRVAGHCRRNHFAAV